MRRLMSPGTPRTVPARDWSPSPPPSVRPGPTYPNLRSCSWNVKMAQLHEYFKAVCHAIVVRTLTRIRYSWMVNFSLIIESCHVSVSRLCPPPNHLLSGILILPELLIHISWIIIPLKLNVCVPITYFLRSIFCLSSLSMCSSKSPISSLSWLTFRDPCPCHPYLFP